MTRTEALIGLNLSMDIGSRRLQKLVDIFGSPEAVFAAEPRQLARVEAIGSRIARYLQAFRQADLGDELARIQRLGLTVVTLYDESYPRNLAFTTDRPIVLYIKGRLEQKDSLALAMVGCRRPSLYGMEQAQRFSAELARRGITVISGMARGIDTCSHEGALKAGGRTIAVIGSGLGRLYPPENGPLAQRISEAGAVISEFPVCADPERFHFPRRNRIISGLALGVLVVEAGRNSGSLITAHCCLDQGRDVFAIPGRIDTLQAWGSNALIQDGACCVSSIEDILENLPFLSRTRQDSPAATEPRHGKPGTLSCVESTLYNIITQHPVTLEALMEQTQLDISRLSAILLGLELKRLITQVTAGTYIRSTHAR